MRDGVSVLRIIIWRALTGRNDKKMVKKYFLKIFLNIFLKFDFRFARRPLVLAEGDFLCIRVRRFWFVFLNTKVQRHRDFIPLFLYSLDHKTNDRGAVKLMYNYMEITCLNISNTNNHEWPWIIHELFFMNHGDGDFDSFFSTQRYRGTKIRQ